MTKFKTKFINFKKKIADVSINKLLGRLSHDIGIDLGTANTIVWVKGKGIVIREPSAVARHKKTKEIIAIGTAAKKMIGRAPAILEIIRPLRDGVIADFDATAAMLSHYISKVHESGGIIPKIPRPRIVIGIPSGVTEVERRAVSDAAMSSGAREAHLIEEPMAAAIGAGLDVSGTDGNFIVDIGGGTSEMGAISLGGMVTGRSIRIAGDEMNEAIINYVRLKYSLLLGEPTAEEAKITIGSAAPSKEEKFFVVRGRDLENGLPKSIKLGSGEVREAISEVISEITKNIVSTLEETPPEILSDIMEKGIFMAGGGSLLTGIDKVVSEATRMPVYIADDPLSCVARGCGRVLEDRKLLERILSSKS